MFALVSSIPLEEIKSMKISLATYLELWGIHRLGSTTSKNITKNVINIEDFYNKLSHTFLGDNMNISMFSNTVDYLYTTLKDKEDDIIMYSQYFNIIENKEKTFNICITNEIYNFKPRNKFADYLEDKYNVTIHIYDSVTKKIDFLVCDARSGTSKETKATKYKIPIVTSKEMEDIVKNEW